ncbi:dTMP kinase [Virgisporangium ochraceum]|uniref:Thymidylate kinase n=1 Tax=Virgisporangium ochraceum TaxID=65505 RepID=A0A8J4A2I0_9ACTN|nr:dTMP kinase [Virgisporangium ochraceum]GIJ74627.1 dTMP kinase [Virgisporangium ochraceum]
MQRRAPGGGSAIAGRTDDEPAGEGTGRDWPHLAPGEPPEIQPEIQPEIRDDPDSEATTRRIRQADDQDHLNGIAELKTILRIRAFRRLWVVLGLSALGDWLGLLATATFAADQVDDSLAKGAAFGSVIAVRLLPALVFGAIAGVFADRFDRRLTMAVCDLLRFAFFLTIPLSTLVTDNSALIVGWAAIATFAIESVSMMWTPAKEAAVPNLIPRARLETANQISLATTYGLTPVAAALLLALLTTALGRVDTPGWAAPTNIALYFNALTFLATACTVYFGIKEISGGPSAQHRERRPGLLKEFVDGWRFIGRTPLVRGLVLGIFGAFAGGGVVIGTAQFYARELYGGDSTFFILFAMLFIGLASGIVGGPRLIGALSRRRWFGMSIVLAAGAVVFLGLAWHLVLAVVFTLFVGVGAGMAFLSGTTLLGGEVDDEMRGRAIAVVQTGVRVVLMLTIALSSTLVGAGGRPTIDLGFVTLHLSTTRILLLVAGVLGVIAGIAALRQMDDKPGVPVLADLWGSLRGRPLSAGEPHATRGLFVVFEGGEGAGKSTQVRLLAEALRGSGRDVVVTREPGATEAGAQIRRMLLDGDALAPRAEALLYAADRAHHVATVVRPALARGAIVVSDRYVDSSLAYQGAGRTLPVGEVAWLSAWATGGLKPDLTVLLDLDPSVGLVRAESRGRGADRLESESLAFHERVRFAFLDLAAADSARYLVVDAERDPERVADVVLDRIRSLLPVPEENRV